LENSSWIVRRKLACETGQARKGNTTAVSAVSPWEKRERGGLYYTRSRKVDGRVVREYVGGGLLGQLAAQMDADKRRRREQEAAAWKAERERIQGLEAPVAQLCEAAEILARATLVAAGYRQHNRGEWRKQRGKQQEK
jgi:hypothetical protein